jgi:hypothetical protein
MPDDLTFVVGYERNERSHVSSQDVHETTLDITAKGDAVYVANCFLIVRMLWSNIHLESRTIGSRRS